MKRNELEVYYFCTPELDSLREKYFPKFKELLGIENFFNNENSTDEERFEKLTDMADKLIEYIFNDDNMKKEFVLAYTTDDDYILGELIVQSVIADEVIKTKNDINIFLDKKSVLYFENGYPKNIIIYKNKNKSAKLFDYIDFFERFKYQLTQIDPIEILGEELIEEINQKVKEFKEKQELDDKNNNE